MLDFRRFEAGCIVDGRQRHIPENERLFEARLAYACCLLDESLETFPDVVAGVWADLVVHQVIGLTEFIQQNSRVYVYIEIGLGAHYHEWTRFISRWLYLIEPIRNVLLIQWLSKIKANDCTSSSSIVASVQRPEFLQASRVPDLQSYFPLICQVKKYGKVVAAYRGKLGFVSC